MAAVVYYKFKSDKDFRSLPVDSNFISVHDLKQKLFQSNALGRGRGFDLTVANHQTQEDYADESTLIPKHTSLVLRRVPLLRPNPIVIAQPQKPVQELKRCHTMASSHDNGVVAAASPANTTTTTTGACSTITTMRTQSRTSSSGNGINFLPELHCPVCQKVMKDAVLTKKCCFRSLCHQCAVGRSKCACGATDITVDRDVVPNITIREYIQRLLEELKTSLHSQGTDVVSNGHLGVLPQQYLIYRKTQT